MEKQEKGVGLLALAQVASRVSVRGPGGEVVESQGGGVAGEYLVTSTSKPITVLIHLQGRLPLRGPT